jgi:hypothetical protein
MRKGDAIDPKGLIAESFKIDGITYEECRSIFLDWALAVPVDSDSQLLITTLLERHPTQGHPMRQVLEEGLASGSAPRRRGGWKGRRS